MKQRSQKLFLAALGVVVASATTAALDWASARWIASATPVVSSSVGEPARRPQEKRGRVLGLKWAERPAPAKE